jgi:uncharacterized protein YgiB involved in biofilm formation
MKNANCSIQRRDSKRGQQQIESNQLLLLRFNAGYLAPRALQSRGTFLITKMFNQNRKTLAKNRGLFTREFISFKTANAQ